MKRNPTMDRLADNIRSNRKLRNIVQKKCNINKRVRRWFPVRLSKKIVEQFYKTLTDQHKLP